MRVSGDGDERRRGIAALVTCRCKTCPCCATTIGTSLALAGLWLLLAVPPVDVVGEHHPSHFWLVFAAAALSAWRALTVGRAARHHGDVRLHLVGLGFLAAVLLCGLHALATPGVLLDHANGGFSLATPVGVLPRDALALIGGVRGGGRVGRGRSPRGTRRAGGPVSAVGARRAGRVVGCGVADRPAPLADPPRGNVGAARSCCLWSSRCRSTARRRCAASCSTGAPLGGPAVDPDGRRAARRGDGGRGVGRELTPDVVALARLDGVGVRLRRLPATSATAPTSPTAGRVRTRGLFDAVGTEATLRAVRVEYGSALEQLVAAVARQEAGELTPAEMSLITSGLAMRFGVSEGQTAVLGRAAAALRADRERIERGMPHASPSAPCARRARDGVPDR